MDRKKKSLKKNLMSLFLSFDQFGQEMKLRIKKKETHNTIFGSLLSIAIYSFIFYTFVVMFFEMYSRTTPNVINTIEYVKDPELTELTLQNFEAAISLFDDLGQPILQDESSVLFIPKLAVCNRTSTQTNGQLTLENKCQYYVLEQCSKVQNKSAILHQMGLEDVQKEVTYCIPKEARDLGIFLQGYGFSNQFQVLALDIYRCNERTRTNHCFYLCQQLLQECASFQEQEHKLGYGYFGMILSDRLFNPKLPRNPFEVYGKVLQSTYSFQQYKVLSIFLRPYVIETIENFYYYFFEKRTVNNELLFEKMVEQASDAVGDSIVSVVIQLDDKRARLFRTYANILDIFGNLGGLLSIVIFLAKILVSPLSQLLLNIFLANKVFTFNKEVEYKEKNEKKRKSQITPEKDFSFGADQNIPLYKHLSGVYPDQISSMEEKQEIGSFKDKLKGIHEGIKFGLIQYLTQTNRSKKQQIHKGINKIYEKIDSVNLVKKIMEIEKLKILLLNQDQLQLFENLPKPQIFFDKQSDTSQLLNQQLTLSIYKKEPKFIDKIRNSYQSYKNIIESKNMTFLDQQLISMIDQKTLTLFNETMKWQDHKNTDLRKLTTNGYKFQLDDVIPIKNNPDSVEDFSIYRIKN